MILVADSRHMTWHLLSKGPVEKLIPKNYVGCLCGDLINFLPLDQAAYHA